MENNNMMEFLKSSPTRTQEMEMSEWEREPKKCTQFPLQMCGVFHKFVLKIKYTLSIRASLTSQQRCSSLKSNVLPLNIWYLWWLYFAIKCVLLTLQCSMHNFHINHWMQKHHPTHSFIHSFNIWELIVMYTYMLWIGSFYGYGKHKIDF